MINSYRFLATILFSCILYSSVFGLNNNQVDTFQDSTTQNWESGIPNPNPPTIITHDGPAGIDDFYLMATATGIAGAGGKLVIFNNSQWTGDYISAGITTISMYVNNFGSTALSLRLAFAGSGGNIWSLNPVSVPAGSGWVIAKFEIDSLHFAGSGANINATLSSVTQLRIIHSVAGGYNGDSYAASLGIDDISAAENPLPVELSSFTAYINNNHATLKWVTQSELNNLGFEVERKSQTANGWIKIGFVNGKGNSNDVNHYTFLDKASADNVQYYRLKQIDFDGSFSLSSEVKVENVILKEFSLEQNYPNPFNPTTKIKYNVPLIQANTLPAVQLKVYDILGNEVALLVNENQPAGSYEVEFNSTSINKNLASGFYFYQLRVFSRSGKGEDLIQTRKMILLK